MAFDALLIDPLRGGPPPAWDDFVAGIGLPAPWRSAVLTPLAWYERSRPLLALVRDGSGEPCALFCAGHLGLPSAPWSYHDPRTRCIAGLVEFHLPPGITTAGHAFHPALDTASRQEVLREVERAIADELGVSCLGFAYRQVSERDLPVFEQGGRRVMAATPETVIDIGWASFDSYLASLPKEDRREWLRIRRNVDADTTVRAGIETSLSGREASRLAHVVRMRYRERFKVVPPYPPAFFDHLSAQGGVRYFTYRDNVGALLAYGTLLDEGVNRRSYTWGALDRAEGGRPNVYFDHFLRQVEHCINTGADRLVMGKGMADIKQRFGGHPVNLYTVVQPRVGLVRSHRRAAA